jgi:hypothetical protein
MGRAKDIVVKPIAAKDANALVKRLHYSGKVVTYSRIHLGVFLNGKCGGVMQFGSSMRKVPMQALVSGTSWEGFIELNRMAFADWLPRNSESRAIGYAFRWMRKQYPHIKWCVSFADGTRCGDGTIYRASGFVLTGIASSPSIMELLDGRMVHKITLFKNPNTPRKELGGKTVAQVTGGQASLAKYAAASGGKLLPGFQLRYIYFLDPEARKRLTVPVLPFSEIQRLGAGMYRGKPSAGSSPVEHIASSGEVGGSIPTPALHLTT